MAGATTFQFVRIIPTGEETPNYLLEGGNFLVEGGNRLVNDYEFAGTEQVPDTGRTTATINTGRTTVTFTNN